MDCRFVLLVIVFALVAALGFFLKRRREHEGLLENRPLNLLTVIVFNLACYLMTGLPSDPEGDLSAGVPRPFRRANRIFNRRPRIDRFGSGSVPGSRPAEENGWRGKLKDELLTSGIYRYARHPICAGIVGISLGVALVFGTWDRLLMIPAILLVNVAEAKIEETFDIGVRFPSEYREYRKRTRMLGPIWFWAILAGILLLIAGVSYL